MTDSPKAERYFKQFKTSRQLQPCYQSIDMRGRVADPCSRYLFNDRIHYMDDRSLLIYQEGLKRHCGVFTNETFEKVINAPHTLDQVHQSGVHNPDLDVDAINFSEQSEESSEELSDITDETIPDPDIIPFGYFKERGEPRLQMICETEVQLGGTRIKSATQDLSVSGARLLFDCEELAHPGDEVLVSYMGLQNEAGGIDVYDIPYNVISNDHQDEGTLLRLQRTNPGKQTKFDKFIENLIKRRDPDRVLDIEDDYQTALAWYYERLYAENTSFVPFFVGKDDTGELLLQSVALTRANQYLTHFFCTSADNYNFTPFCLPHRLQALQQGKNLLLAMYRDQGGQDRSQRIHSAANIEYDSDEAFLNFVQHALSFPEHCVVKVISGTQPARPVSATKIALFSGKLRSLSAEQAGQLDAQIASLQFVAYVTDMTGWAQQWKKEPSAKSESAVLAWVGSEQRNSETGEVFNKLEMDWRHLNPDLIRFGYVERRRENRYLAKTAVSVQMRDETFDCLTIDLSWHGLRVLLPARVDIRQGAMIKVGLSTMQTKRETLDLMNIPYRIVNFLYTGDGTVLSLERIAGNRDSAMDEFFDELIKKNRHKLPVDTADIVNAATAGVFESLQCSNTAAITFFLGMDPDRGACLQYLGVPADGNALAQAIGLDGGRKFGYLFSKKLVKALYDAVQLMARNPSKGQDVRPAFEFDMFVYSDSGNDEPADLRVASEFDAHDKEEWKAICHQIMDASRWRGLHVVVSAAHAIEDKLFDALLSGMRAESKHRAIRLSDRIVSVAGCGEIIDVTDELGKLPH